MESTVKIGAIALVSILTSVVTINSSTIFAPKTFQCKIGENSSITTNSPLRNVCYPRIYMSASSQDR